MPKEKRRRVATLALTLLLFVCAAPCYGQAWTHPFDYPQSQLCPEEVLAVVEIPAGSFIKYELDTESGHVVVDRFQSVPLVYPANYGTLTQTRAADGDNLDVLIYTRAPVQAGALIRMRPIGILKMIDGGEQDDKIIAVPAPAVDPTFADVRSVNDLPAIERERIEFFFRAYKDLPAGRKKVELGGIGSADTAKNMIRAASAEYAKTKKIRNLPCAAKVGST